MQRMGTAIPKFVETLDPENVRPLNNAELREVWVKLRSPVTSVTDTHMSLYMAAMLESACDHMQKRLVRSASSLPPNPAGSSAASGWRWEDIDVLITAMPPFSRLMMYKHIFSTQVRPLRCRLHAMHSLHLNVYVLATCPHSPLFFEDYIGHAKYHA